MSTDSELLRRYAREGSEAAFAELVGRHINVIYSAAWRQVGGDSDLAWDVTQEVFTDLARKAKRLTSHPKLAGWLYLSTRYIAAKARRSEERRRAREEKACQMAPEWSSDDSDTDWEELSPVLDEALCDLKSADREAVLLRFFESRSFSEVGRELGLNENAARMRVERALEKLRVALKRHGVASIGSGALANFLTHRAVSAAPTGMAAKITQTALPKAAESIGAFTLAATIDAMKGKLLLGAVAIAMTAPFFWRAPSDRQAGSLPTESALEPKVSNQRLDAAPSSGSRQWPQRTAPKETTGMVSETDPGERLELHLVAADGGEPIVGATLDYRVLTGNGLRERDYITDEAGVSMIRFPSDVKEATLTSRIEGFADTTLEWRPEHGESIPELYRLTVERAVPIGGRVVGPDGRPVADATVRIGHEAMPGSNRPESHKFGGMRVATDDQGEWKVRRIAREMIDRLHGHASHPRYVTSDVVEFGRNATAKLKLREKRFEFQLKPGVVVRGKVTTANGFPVADANVLLGHLDQAGSRETSTDESGRFLLEGCRLGERYLTASAKGYAATTRRVEISSDSSPFNLVLNEGKTLRLRVVDRAGKPIPNAKVSLDTFHGLRTDFTKPAPVRVQTEFSRKTGAEGRVVWRHAPDQTLSFGVFAKGYMRRERVTVDPGGNEKVIALDPALSVMGTVQDAATGRPVPRFQMVCGHPSREEKHEPRWSRLERFWLRDVSAHFSRATHGLSESGILL